MTRIILGVLVALIAVLVALSGDLSSDPIAASAVPLMGIVAFLLIAYGTQAVKAKRNPEPRHKPPQKPKLKKLPHMPPPVELDHYTTASSAPPPTTQKKLQSKPARSQSEPVGTSRTATCRDCAMLVSRSAKACPHCGAPDPTTGIVAHGCFAFITNLGKFLIGIGSLLVLLWVLAVCSGIDLSDFDTSSATTRRATTTRTPTTRAPTTTTLLSLEHQILAVDIAVEACNTSAEFPKMIGPFEAGAMILVIWQADKPPMNKTTEDRLVNAIGLEIRNLCPELIP